MTDPLVSTEWLARRLDLPDVRVIDIRGFVRTRMIASGVEEATYVGAPAEYVAGHIPGAVFVDWTRDIIDPADPVPAQVAPPERFAEAMSQCGVGDPTHVVAYDHSGGQFATRLWWALHYYGHDQVSVLDGGWNRWTAEGRPVSTEAPPPTRRAFTPRVHPGWRATLDQVRAWLGSSDVQLVDARGEDQYTGTKRRGKRGGHIPGARSLPRSALFAPAGGFKSLDELRQIVAAAGIDLDSDRPVVGYCNGGVAATAVLFTLYRLGRRTLTNYDGSWNEWGNRDDVPVERGP